MNTQQQMNDNERYWAERALAQRELQRCKTYLSQNASYGEILSGFMATTINYRTGETNTVSTEQAGSRITRGFKAANRGLKRLLLEIQFSLPGTFFVPIQSNPSTNTTEQNTSPIK